jgi:diphthamide biosynthesis protein 3
MSDPKCQEANPGAYAEAIGLCPQHQPTCRGQNPRASRQMSKSNPIQHHDNLALISLYLSTPQGTLTPDQDPTETLSLLSHDFQTFTTNIPSLIQPLSTLLNTSIQNLRALSTKETDAEPTRPSHNARARARDRRVRTSMAPNPRLADELSARVRALRQIQLAEIPALRREMAATAAEVVALQAGVLERMVVVLERAKYGALARATRAKAEHLAIVAQGVEGKLEYVLGLCFCFCVVEMLTCAGLRNWRLRG